MAKTTPEERVRAAALAAEDHARAAAEKRIEWVRNGTYLTWEEYVAGVACRGCGMPWHDGRAPEQDGSMYWTEEEKAAGAAEYAAFRARHPTCKTARIVASGSLTIHCQECCPPPPLSPRQRDRIEAIFSFPVSPQSQNRWQLTLTCGHTTERTAHADNSTPRWGGAVTCEPCQDFRGIVSQVNLGRAQAPAPPAPKPRPATKRERERAAARVVKRREALLQAERELAEAEATAAEQQ